MTNPNKATTAFTDALANHLPAEKKPPVVKTTQAEDKAAFVQKYIEPIAEALKEIAPASFDKAGFILHDHQGNAVFALKFTSTNPKTPDNYQALHPYFSLSFSDSENRRLDLRVSYDGIDGKAGAKLVTENGDLSTISTEVQTRLAQWVARVSPASVPKLHRALTGKKSVSRLPRT